jgi:hypothetical protein
MPFYDETTSIQDVTNIAPDEPAPTPTMLETWGAAFRTQNTIGSAIANSGIPDPGVVDQGAEDFNAIDYVKDDPKYSPFVESFAGIRNKRAAEAQKLRIDQELQDQRTLSAAGGMGAIAQMAAGVIDLPTLFPVGGEFVAGGRLARAANIAIGAGLDAGVSEAALQATQATRTREESALNIGGSIILGGAVGTLVGRLGAAEARSLSKKIEGQDAAFSAADKEFANLGKGTSAGAAATDTGPLTLKDEGFISKLPIVNRQDPLIRLQLNELDAGRQAVRGLAETPLEYADNAAGIATERGGAVETRMKMWHGPLASALREIDTSFARYYHSTPEPTAFQRFLSPAMSEFDRFRGSTDRLTYKQFKEEVGKAAFSGEQHPIAQVAEAARVYRKLDDAMKKAAIEAKLLPEDVTVKGDVSHLFRMYNKERIIAQRDRFSAILNDYFIQKRNEAARIAETPLTKKAEGEAIDPKAAAARAKAEEFGRMSDGEIRGVVDDTINSILGHADSRIPYDIVAGPRGPLKERLLNIESAKIQDFLNTDVEEVLRAQVRTMSADVEIARKFGSVDMAEQFRKINDEADAKIAAATSDKARQRLEASRKAALRDLAGIRDRLRGTYALPSNPDSLVLRAGRIARNVNYLRLLGGMTVSAIPDLGKVVFSHGLTSAFRDGFLPMVRNFKAFRLAAQEVKDAGTALDMVLDSRAMAMADITDDFGRHSAFERGLSSLTTRFGVVSLMAPWNATLKQFTGLVTMTNILRSAERVATGTASVGDIRKLASSGIDADLAERIWRQFAGDGPPPTAPEKAASSPPSEAGFSLGTNSRTYFHGGRADLTEFSDDFRRDGTPKDKYDVRGIYVTENRRLAEQYVGKDGKVHEVEIDAKNPITLPDPRFPEIDSASLTKKDVETLKAAGYDSVVNNERMEIALFDGKQVRLKGLAPKKHKYELVRADHADMGLPEPKTGIDDRVYAIHRDGEPVGYANIEMRGDQAYVKDIFNVDTLDTSHSLGTAAVGQILRQFVKENPGVKTLAGERVSGARRGGVHGVAGTGEDVVIPLPRVRQDIREPGPVATERLTGHGEIQDGIMLPRAADWTDKEAQEAFRAAVVREVDRAIVTPGQDKPLWMSTELGKAVGQFKSFGISSMQKTMLAGLQQRDAATLNGVMLSLGLGAMTYWAKMATTGHETSDDPAQWAVEALDKSGLTGWLMDANNIAEKATRGRVGFSALTGKQVSRFASRNVTGAFLGPSADAIADIFQVSGSIFAGDTTQGDLHKLRQLVPAQNLFYLRSLFDKVEKATGSALNLPETKKQ